ncbi:hypothetical protein [Paenibacillus sp. P36]|uniref:hypothetical protein n=1 Tax=Paenibacillus sp. P36 TaxID=3342538 RepID=UPI0038B31AD3
MNADEISDRGKRRGGARPHEWVKVELSSTFKELQAAISQKAALGLTLENYRALFHSIWRNFRRIP